jgi:hypothetical protein
VAEWYRRSFDHDEHPGDPRYEVVADGQRQDAVVTCAGGEVRIGIGPDLRTARLIAR